MDPDGRRDGEHDEPADLADHVVGASRQGRCRVGDERHDTGARRRARASPCSARWSPRCSRRRSTPSSAGCRLQLETRRTPGWRERSASPGRSASPDRHLPTRHGQPSSTASPCPPSPLLLSWRSRPSSPASCCRAMSPTDARRLDPSRTSSSSASTTRSRSGADAGDAATAAPARLGPRVDRAPRSAPGQPEGAGVIASPSLPGLGSPDRPRQRLISPSTARREIVERAKQLT